MLTRKVIARNNADHAAAERENRSEMRIVGRRGKKDEKKPDQYDHQRQPWDNSTAKRI